MKFARWMLLSISLAITTGLPAHAQDSGVVTMPHHPMAAPDTSPYAAMARRPVKALSDEQMADLKAGRGMGLALPAELNGYPGPRHVLDLAEQLQLTDQQRAKTRSLFDAMKAEAVPIGERILADEIALDRLFAEHRITQAALAELTTRIGVAQGELRAAHLRYHLSMMDVLSADQVARYVALRGYGAKGHHSDGMH
jgi:Spy/CpxP family protein refolding chaperone